MPDLLFLLLMGHILGDFALQSDHMARHKGESKTVLSWHVTIYSLCIAASLWVGLYLHGSERFFSLATLVVMAVLWIVHWCQDYLKVTRFNGSKQSFFVDQALHLLMLYLIRIFVYYD